MIRVTDQGLALFMQSPTGPFIQKDGKAFLRYDALEIHNNPDPHQGLIVRFMWGGEAMAALHIERVRLEHEMSFGVQGISGQLEVHASAS